MKKVNQFLILPAFGLLLFSLLLTGCIPPGHPGLGLTDSCHLIFDVTHNGETSTLDFTSRSSRDVIRYNWRVDGTSYCWIYLDSFLSDFSVEGLGDLNSFHIMFPAPLSVGTFEREDYTHDGVDPIHLVFFKWDVGDINFWVPPITETINEPVDSSITIDGMSGDLAWGSFEAEIGTDFSIEGQFSARINLDIEP
jgi:hypothetical protein